MENIFGVSGNETNLIMSKLLHITLDQKENRDGEKKNKRRSKDSIENERKQERQSDYGISGMEHKKYSLY